MDPLTEVVKLIGGLAIALMSMAIASYALAVPRLQRILSKADERLDRRREQLEIDMKKPEVGISVVESELEEWKRDRRQVTEAIQRLGWDRVVVIPSACSMIALLLVSSALLFSSVFDPILIAFSVILLVIATIHLLLSLRKIQWVAVKEIELTEVE